MEESKNEVVSIRINSEIIEKLKEEARQQSFYEKKEINYADVIRSMLAEEYKKKPILDEEQLGSWDFFKDIDFDQIMKIFDDGRIRGDVNKTIEKRMQGFLKYESLPSYLLQDDKLSPGIPAQYDKEGEIAGVLGQRGAVADIIIDGDEVLCPTFEIAANPGVRLCDLEMRNIYEFQKVLVCGLDEIRKEESSNMINLCTTLCNWTKSIKGQSLGTFFSQVDEEKIPCSLVTHPKHYAEIAVIAAKTKSISTLFGTDVQRTKLMVERLIEHGRYCYNMGHIKNIKILLDENCPVTTAFIIKNKPNETGVRIIRQPLTLFFLPEIKKLRLEFVMYEEIGFMMFGSSVEQLELP